jgi:hypothetical protein
MNSQNGATATFSICRLPDPDRAERYLGNPTNAECSHGTLGRISCGAERLLDPIDR